MQTTQNLIQQLKGKRITLCTHCGRQVIRTGASQRAIEDGLIEIGEACPNCDYWYHWYFLNDELQRSAPQTGDNRKMRREYKSHFDRFQKKTRARLKMKKIRGAWRRPEKKVVDVIQNN